MSTDDPCLEPHTSVDKGKQRAVTPEPSERTPLLPSSSSHATHQSLSLSSLPERPPHQNLLRKLLIVFSATLVACVTVLVLVILLAFSYSSRVSSLTVQDILDRGLVIEGPNRIDVLNATKEDGVWVKVDGRVGLDMGRVLRIRREDEDFVWTDVWKGIGRWGVRKVGMISVELSQITVTSLGEPSVALAVLTTATIELPLSPDPPSHLNWLTPMSIPVRIQPTGRAEDLVHFANESWMSGIVQVSSIIPSVRVIGGKTNGRTWRGGFRVERSNVSIALRTKGEVLPLPRSDTQLNRFQYRNSLASRIPERTRPSLHFRNWLPSRLSVFFPVLISSS
jgi:hypothetical protein